MVPRKFYFTMVLPWSAAISGHLEPQSSVATLQRHLWSNVCSKFHENKGILKPISQKCDMEVFFT